MSFDPHSNEWLLNKYETYKDLRSRDSAYWCEKYQVHVITRYDDVLYGLNNPKLFSSAKGNLLIESEIRHGKTLGASDNPIHSEYKNIVKNAYSKDNIKRVSDVFVEKAIEHLENKTEINISEVTEELCAWVVSEILNFPIDKEQSKNMVLNLHRYEPNIHLFDPVLDAEAFNKDLVAENDIIYETFRKRIRPKGPGVYHECFYNNPNHIEITLCLLANIYSGTASLVGALQYLTMDLYHQKKLDTLLNDRSLISDAVNESLRFNASAGRFYRTITEQVIMHDTFLKPGDRVALCLESANRDPDKFANPDEFIITRDNAQHLSWGHGIHTCIALAISKEMLNRYLEILLDKVGKYDIITEPSDLKYVMVKGGNIDIMSNIILRKS